MNLDGAIEAFRRNGQAVERLLDFDHVILEVAVQGLRELEQQLDDRNLHSALPLVRNRAALLENLKVSDSLRPQYEAIFNQCVVLLVAYFASAPHTLFRESVAAALTINADVPATTEQLKMSWRTVVEAEDEKAQMFAELLIAHHDISFQDMQSVSRAFSTHLKIDPPRFTATNDIIVGQAARHVIAHAAPLVDRKMLNQVRAAAPRTLKPILVEGEAIRFSPTEVKTLAASMEMYLADLTDAVKVWAEMWSVATRASALDRRSG